MFQGASSCSLISFLIKSAFNTRYKGGLASPVERSACKGFLEKLVCELKGVQANTLVLFGNGNASRLLGTGMPIGDGPTRVTVKPWHS